MPKIVNTTVAVITNQSVPVQQEIHNIYINTEGNVFWDIWSWTIDGQDNRLQHVKTDFYSFPFAQIVDVGEDGKFNILDVEGILWALTSAIDAIPTGTAVEKRDKALCKRAFKVNIN